VERYKNHKSDNKAIAMVSDLPPEVNIFLYIQFGTILPAPISIHLNGLGLMDLQAEGFSGMFILPFVLHVCLTNIPVSIERGSKS
jgi:hypothetical protein